jgi:EamA-like transporter family.
MIAVILLTPFVLPKLNDLDYTRIVDPTISGGLLYLGIVSTAGGFLLWNKGLQLMNASSGGLFFFFQPIVGAFLGWLLLQETIGASFWLGTILIFSGVFIVMKDE